MTAARCSGKVRRASIAARHHSHCISKNSCHAGRMSTTDDMTPAQARAILDVSPGADDDGIKKAYRRLVREHHPDTLMAQGLPQAFIDQATARMAQINRAYDVLRPEKQAGDRTDQLWTDLSGIFGIFGMYGDVVKGAAQVHASALAMTVVACPLLRLNPFFAAWQATVNRFANVLEQDDTKTTGRSR